MKIAKLLCVTVLFFVTTHLFAQEMVAQSAKPNTTSEELHGADSADTLIEDRTLTDSWELRELNSELVWAWRGKNENSPVMAIPIVPPGKPTTVFIFNTKEPSENDKVYISMVAIATTENATAIVAHVIYADKSAQIRLLKGIRTTLEIQHALEQFYLEHAEFPDLEHIIGLEFIVAGKHKRHKSKPKKNPKWYFSA